MMILTEALRDRALERLQADLADVRREGLDSIAVQHALLASIERLGAAAVGQPTSPAVETIIRVYVGASL